MFFIDNADSLISGEHEQDKRKFINLMEKILQTCSNIKVIITCRDLLSQASEHETHLEVPGLRKEKKIAWDLFKSVAGETIPKEQRV